MEWLAWLLAIVAGVPIAAWLAQDRLVFFPQPLASTAHLPAAARPLEIVASDGIRLRGWIRPSNGAPAPVVLYFGGNAEEVSWTLADRRWPAHWSIVAINYRGYGMSEGKPGEAALVSDALAIHDAIAAQAHVDRARIVAFGRSLGTGIAVKLAAQRPLGGVVLVSPYDSLVAIGETHYPWLPVRRLLRHRFDVAAEASALRVPLLAIVGDRDTIIPHARSRALYDAWAGPKRWEVMEAADHDGVAESNRFWEVVGGFLAEVAAP
jgi:pimeloyl-ACP methyl ester carboxylesterase